MGERRSPDRVILHRTAAANLRADGHNPARIMRSLCQIMGWPLPKPEPVGKPIPKEWETDAT